MGKKPAFSDEYLEKIDGIDWEANWPDVCRQFMDLSHIANKERICQEYHKNLWRMAALYGWAFLLLFLFAVVSA